MPFAISLRDAFYTDHQAYPWTHDPRKANTWPDLTVPDSIIAYWQKVHYSRIEKIGGEDRLIATAIGGRSPLQAVVVPTE